MLEVEYVGTEELIPYENNTKIHTEEQIRQVADSIKEFGFVNPVLIDKNNIIVAGHGRVEASKLLGMKDIPVIKLHTLTDTQRKALTIADNQLTLSTGFNMELLESEIASIMEEDEDLVQMMGFSEDELNEINCGIEEEVDIQGETDEEDTPELESNPVIQFGDLIEFSNGSRIICGDSTDAETYNKLMQGDKARMVNTDPPFGVDYQSARFGETVNDDLTGKAFSDFLVQCFRQLHKHTIENPALYIFYVSITQGDFEDALEKTGFRVKQQIIWKKNQFAFGRSDYHWIHEPMFYAVKTEKNSQWFGDRCGTTYTSADLEEMDKNELIELIQKIQETSTVWEISRDSTAMYVHPTQKPVALAERAIRNSSEKDDIVLEPFSGSGSTLLGGFKAGRRVYAIEFDVGYVQVGIQRMVEFSGEEMVSINGEMVNWYDYKKEN